MKQELKLDVIGFMCLLIGILISLFIKHSFWIGLGLVILAFGLFIYSLHIETIRFKNEIKKIDRETTQELMDKFDKLCEEYSCEDIDVKLLKKLLKKGVIDIINNWSS